MTTHTLHNYQFILFHWLQCFDTIGYNPADAMLPHHHLLH